MRHSASRIPHSTWPCGQASLELTVAMIGALLLLFGSLKVFLWLNERIIARQIAYERSRVTAGTDASVVQWSEPAKRLEIFK